jgi:2-polyprenyl-3-methyl-5-hydroxy-6-metoxy-1,4-benzoquinol methylase
MNEPKAGAFELQQTIDAWDSDYYHPIAERYYDRAVSRMLELLGAKPGDTILDAGCGPGVHSIRAARAGLKVKAIDFSETMLVEARRRVERAGVDDSVEFAREDLTRLSFPDGTFRHVFSWGVIIHIRDIEQAIDELTRIVAPGGRLALYVTNDSAWDHKLEAAARVVTRKPLSGLEKLPMGRGIWYDWKGERLWVWWIDAHALIRYAEARGMKQIARVGGEFTEIQHKLRGSLRHLLLHGNNLTYRLGLPPGPAATNLFVFEKK